jgi:hypothetical protein
MSDYGAAKMAPAPDSRDSRWSTSPDWLADFEPSEAAHTIKRFRFVPPSCLVRCNPAYDHGIDELIYLQSIITDEVD